MRVRARWKEGLILLIAAALANLALVPEWNSIQTAEEVPRFLALTEGGARVIASAGCDVLFAATYGVLGFVGSRRWGTGPLASVAAVMIVVGAAFDELENAALIANVLRGDSLSQAWLDAMRALGTLKYIAAPGVLILNGFLVHAAIRRRSARRSTPSRA